MAYRVEEYRAAVLLDYSLRKAAGGLRHNLLHPTPGKLKDEALYVCSHRFKRSDEHILIEFFESQKDQAAYIAEIKKADLDDFRPLLNFLKGRTETPDMRQVELLAWLTDFANRPYAKYIVVVPEGQQLSAGPNDAPPDEDKEDSGQKGKKRWGGRRKTIEIIKRLNLWKYTGLLLFASLLVLMIYLKPVLPDRVYVCDSTGAKRFHLRKDCTGLRNCKHQIVEISLDSAKRTGRTLCHLEGG